MGNPSERSSFDIESYANKYSGYGRLQRLKFLAEKSPKGSFKLEAYRFLLDELCQPQCLNTTLYKIIAEETVKEVVEKSPNQNQEEEEEEENSDTPMQIEQQQKAESTQEQNHGSSNKIKLLDQIVQKYGPKYEYDSTMVESKTVIVQRRLEKLEQELNKYKSSLIKESIRMGHNDLGEFYCEIGDLSSSLKSYVRTRDFCTINKHIIEMCLNVIKISIHSGDFLHVTNYVAKGQQTFLNGEAPDPATGSMFSSALGLSFLKDKKYLEAAKRFLACSIDIGSNFNEIINCEDIAIYGGLCALASFSRHELKEKVVDSNSFKNFLELVPRLRELIMDFYSGNYVSCLNYMKEYKDELMMDMHLQPHIEDLYKQIRNRALIQYFYPYLSVDMTVMASAFNTTVANLEQEIAALIMDGKIAARIDSHKKILYTKQTDERLTTYREAFEVGRQYINDTKSMLFRLNLKKNNIVVSLDE